MIPLTAREVKQALGSTVGASVTGVSIDSRSIRPGDVFVALRGERFDGHDFVASAFAAGAAAAVVEAGWAEGHRRLGRPLIQVDDTLQALSALARAVRRKSGATVFAITGSVGKTSTKDVLSAMVGRVRRTVATAANQNNEVGVPLTLLSLEPDTEAAIVEMGMRGLGQIAALAAVVQPDIGVITNIHPVHLELLGCIENVAQAKAELITGIRRGGAVVIPSGCGLLEPYVTGSPHRVVRFSVRPEECLAEVGAWFEDPREVSSCTVGLRWPEGEAHIETCYLADYRLENIAAATAACYAAGLPVGACAAGLADVRFSHGRGEVLELPGIMVVDDSYNANPAAVKAALDGLVRLAADAGRRPVAVLGDMCELGEGSERFHREVGEYAAEVGVAVVWGVGRRALGFVEGFRARTDAERNTGLGRDTSGTAGHVESSEETSPVVDTLRPGDAVLFKASRSMRLERMVDRVVALAEAGRWAPPAGPARLGSEELEKREPC